MIARRVGRLESRHQFNSGLASRPRLRLIVSLPWKRPAELATSTCKRTLQPDYGLTELVRLDGGEDGITDAELEKFIASFPVEIAGSTR
jgi:hypothetical protein